MDFFHSYIDESAILKSSEVLASGFISEGKVVVELEDKLASSLGISHPVTVNSGTAALHLGLVLAGVHAGDEVIVPPQTFVATAQAVLMCGATPVFCDISPRDGNMTPESLLEAITPRTRAVIPVHWGGYPCDLDPINAIAEESGIAVLEDAAHALGATYRDRPIGSISRFTAFSFQAIKHVTTGDGGALCCRELEDTHQARSVRWFGIDRTASTTNILGERDYDLSLLGFKYHMNNIAAAIGLGNLRTFEERLARHKLIAKRYMEALEGIGGIEFPCYANDRESAWWFFPVLVEDREDFVRAMISRGAACSVVHRRIDTNSLFAEYRRSLPGQDEFDRLQINLPVHVGLSDKDVEIVVSAVRQGW